jgi:hypothetical protein
VNAARAVAPRSAGYIVRLVALRFLPALLLVAAAAAPLRGQGTVWVSPTGNDANAGTEERPLKTLEGARDLVRTMNADMRDDITVFISGDYSLHNPVRFGPRDSATNGYSIIYTAAPEAHPVVSGGIGIGGWAPEAGNPGSWSAPAVPPGSRPWAGSAGVAFLGGNPVRLGPPSAGQGGYGYRPRRGENPSRSGVILATGAGFIAIEGTGDSPVRGLVFKDIDFEYSGGDAAVTVAKAADIQFLEDRFLYCAGAAIEVDRADAVTVDTALFGGLGGGAVRAAGTTNLRVSQSRFDGVGTLLPPGEGVVLSLRGSTAQVDHCLFENYPTGAIRADESSVSEEANLERPPLVPFHGDSPAAAAAPGAGPSPYNRPLVDERLSASVPPDPPALVRAFALGRAALVTWVPSGFSGGEPYDRFTVTASTGTVARVPAAEFFKTGYVTISNLEPGQPVSFTVAAATAAGEGGPSAASAEVAPSRRLRTEEHGQPRASVERHGNEVTVVMSPPLDMKSPVVAYSVGISGLPAVPVQGLDVWANAGQGPVIRTFPVPGGAAGSVVVFATGAGRERKPAVGAVLRLPASQTPNPGR